MTHSRKDSHQVAERGVSEEEDDEEDGGVEELTRAPAVRLAKLAPTSYEPQQSHHLGLFQAKTRRVVTRLRTPQNFWCSFLKSNSSHKPFIARIV